MTRFNGLRIIESVYLTEPGEPYEVRRAWKERWLTRPWQPWKTAKTVIPQVPMKGGYRLGNSIVMHPVMVQQLKTQLAKDTE